MIAWDANGTVAGGGAGRLLQSVERAGSDVTINDAERSECRYGDESAMPIGRPNLIVGQLPFCMWQMRPPSFLVQK